MMDLYFCFESDFKNNTSGWAFGDLNYSQYVYIYSPLSAFDGHDWKIEEYLNETIGFESEAESCYSWPEELVFNTKEEFIQYLENHGIKYDPKQEHLSMYGDADYMASLDEDEDED